jgi:hypothetical protein
MVIVSAAAGDDSNNIAIANFLTGASEQLRGKPITIHGLMHASTAWHDYRSSGRIA